MRALVPTLLATTLLATPTLAQETAQERDVGFIQGLIEDNLSSTGREVIIEGFEGALSSRATFDLLTIADDEGVWLRAEGLVFDWTRSALLSGEIDVEEMSADVISFIRSPIPTDEGIDLPDPEAQPFEFALPELPVGIQIDRIEAGRIVLGAPLLGEELAFSVDGAVSLSGGEGTATLLAQRLDGAEGAFEITGSYSNDSRVLGLTMDLSEEEGGIIARILGLPDDPSVRLALDGTAPIDDYTADLAIATAGVDRITGNFGFVNQNGAQDLRLDISGDVNALIETDYADFFGPEMRLALTGGRDAIGTLRLNNLTLEAQALSLNGSAEIAPDGWPRHLDLTGTLAARDGAPVLLPIGGGETQVQSADIDLSFDAEAGDLWTLTTSVVDLVQPGLSAPQLSLSGTGTIAQGTEAEPGVVDGDLIYSSNGLSFADPGLSQAIGSDIRGTLAFVSVTDAPFEITSLTLEGPGIEAAAEATVHTADGLRIETSVLTEAGDLSRFALLTGLDLSGAADLLLTGEARPLDGMFDITLRGTTDDLALGIPALDPQLAGNGTLLLEAARDTEGTRVETLTLTAPQILAAGSADITSTGSDATFDITVQEVGLSLPELSGPATFTGTALVARDQSGTLNVALTLPNADLEVSAIAAAPDAGGQITLDLTGDVEDLAPYAPLAGADLSGSASFAVTGDAARDFNRFDLIVRAQTQDLVTGIPQADNLLAGTGQLQTRALRVNADAFRVEGLTLSTPQLALDADASLTAGAVASTFDVALTDLADVVDTLPGPASLSGTLRRSAEGVVAADVAATAPGQTTARFDGTVQTGGSDISVDGMLTASIGRLTAFSTLAGQPFSGALSVELDGMANTLQDPANSTFSTSYVVEGTNLSGFDRSLPGAVALAGTAARDADGQLTLDTVATGPGDARIDLQGTLADTTLTGELRGTIAQLAPYSTLAQRPLSGRLSTTLSGSAQTDLSTFDGAFTLNGSDLSVDGTALTGGVDLTGTAGRRENGTMSLMLGGTAPGATTIDLSAAGTDRLETDLALTIGNLAAYRGLIGQPLSGRVEADLSGWVAPADLSFDLATQASTTNLDPGITAAATLLRGTGTLQGQISRDADGSLAAQDLSIRYPNFTLTADLDSRDGGGQGRFDLRIANVGLFIDDFSGPGTASGTAQLLSGGGYRLNVDATGPGQIAATVVGDIAPSGTLDLDVAGTVPLGLANSFIEPRRLSGTATFDLAVNGPPEVGSVTGQVRLADGRLAAPSFQQALENIGGTIALTGRSAQLGLEGSLEDGGRVTISGPVGLAAPFEAGLQIAGENLVLRDPTLYETTVDALVTVTGPLTGGAQIAGQVNLGPTEIQVPSSTASALGPLPQVTHIGAPADVARTLERAGLTLGGVELATEDSGRSGAFGLDLTISAPARVFIRGRGLDAELGGQLRITGTTAQIIPIGEFSLIRGRIDILEQRFQLDEGGAFLQGDFDPFLRLVATTEARDGTLVTITVEGPATEPEVTFSSSPDLPQDEVLSRLIFGRDLSEISPLQAIQLAAAVSTLAGNSSGGLLSDFRQDLGLDDLDVTTDEDGNAAVRAGAYISENVYTDVTVGTENTEINLNLDLTDDITITGSTGTDGETSLGIFFERDY